MARWWRRSAQQGGPSELGVPDDGPVAGDLSDRHLLLVPSTVGVAQVDLLLRSRVRDCRLAETGEVSLGRLSRLTGPYELSMEEAVDAAVPMPWTVVYAVEAPVEREDPPLPGVDDRDGFARAFPDGLPWREEGRALHLLAGLARRLHGAVRTAGTNFVIQPDPLRAVDYAVHTPFWLEPTVLLGVVARELPTAALEAQGQDWAGPAEEAYTGEIIMADTRETPLPPEILGRLHAQADVADLEVLAGEDVIDAYAVVGAVGAAAADGSVEVLVHGADGDRVILEQDWAQQPFITYDIRWLCPDPAEREQLVPPEHHLQSRQRVRPVVTAVARAVVEATSGVITDEDGFLVDRYSL